MATVHVTAFVQVRYTFEVPDEDVHGAEYLDLTTLEEIGECVHEERLGISEEDTPEIE